MQLGCEDPNHSKNILSEWVQGLHHIGELGHSLDPGESKNQHSSNHHDPLRHRVQINMGLPLETGLPRSYCMCSRPGAELPDTRLHQSHHSRLYGKLRIQLLGTYFKDLLEFSHVPILGTLGYFFFSELAHVFLKGTILNGYYNLLFKLEKAPSRISLMPFTLVEITLEDGADKEHKWFYNAVLTELCM